MSDDKMPAWAEAMEHRIVTEVGKAIADIRVEMREMRADINRRFDGMRDDLTVSMSRADRAHNRVDQEQEELRALRMELSKVWLRLRDLEHRVGLNGGGNGSKPQS